MNCYNCCFWFIDSLQLFLAYLRYDEFFLFSYSIQAFGEVNAFTANLQAISEIKMVTFDTDSAVSSAHVNQSTALCELQSELNNIQEWMKLWRIQINESKSVHISYKVQVNNKMVFDRCSNICGNLLNFGTELSFTKETCCAKHFQYNGHISIL